MSIKPPSTTMGAHLREVRELRGGSLRSTAKAVGISASYLLRLERDEIESPSPRVLYSLAEHLAIPYSDLMKLAGYVVPLGATGRTAPPGRPVANALAVEDLTEAEARELARYLGWIRFRGYAS